MNNDTLSKFAWVAFIAVIVLGGVYMIGQFQEEPVKIENKETVQPETLEYMVTEVKMGFISECVSETVPYEYCRCAFDYMHKEMGIERLIIKSIDYYHTDGLDEEMNRMINIAALHCISELR